MSLVTRSEVDTLLGDQLTSFNNYIGLAENAKLKDRADRLVTVNTISRVFTDVLAKLLAGTVIDQLAVDRFEAA